MKIYVLMSLSVDETTCADDGATNGACADVIGERVFTDLKEALEVRDQTIETDLEDFKDLWNEEDGYSYDVGKMGDDPSADKYIDVYYNGSLTSETTYKVREMEL